jgi:3-hydroxybutyrate dehydrogenase
MQPEPIASLAGRHALITGGGRGIGAAIAAALAKSGMQLTLLGRERTALERTAAELDPRRTFAVTADVSDARSVEDAFASARERFGPVHVLINNAGQAASAPFVRTDPALWHRLVAVNLTGTYLCSRQAVPDMLAEKYGRIVNVASVAGLRGAAYISAYAASKHGVIGLTRALALELALKNVTVNAVCPGYADTQIVRDAIANIRAKTGRSEAEAIEALAATNAQRRLIEPREVAHTVLWLIAPGSESITGQSIVIAGGEVT